MWLKQALRKLPLLTLIWLASPGADAQADGYSPRIGEPHQDFVLPRLTDGRPVALSHFRGRKVLLIHSSSW